VDPETGKLVLLNPPTINVRDSPPRVTSRCYLDVSIGGVTAGRLEVDLYGDVAPRAAENFRVLCTGEKGFGYAGTSFYKVLSGIALQGGDVNGDGLGRSSYGDTFPHDGYDIMHNTVGLVSMVNSGVGGASGRSDSRFLIQPVDDAGFLDSRYEAFGRVTAGLDVVERINAVRVSGSKQKPVQAERVTIERAGEIPMGQGD
jgi:cyclophilin family peptidyl-prolyl cis-trans isomerase